MLCRFVKVDNCHHGASPHGVQWSLVLGAQHTNLFVSAQWHHEFCSCRCCVHSNYQAVVFDIAMVCALADKQPRPHGNAPRRMEFHGNAMGSGTQIQKGLCQSQSNYLFQVDILSEFD